MLSNVLLVIAAICFGIAAVSHGKHDRSPVIALVPAGLFFVTLALLFRGVTIE